MIKQNLLALFFLLIGTSLFGQNELPDVTVKSLSGKEVNFNTISKIKDTSLVISFWATWCIPCITEMEVLHEQYEEKTKGISF